MHVSMHIMQVDSTENLKNLLTYLQKEVAVITEYSLIIKVLRYTLKV